MSTNACQMPISQHRQFHGEMVGVVNNPLWTIPSPAPPIRRMEQAAANMPRLGGFSGILGEMRPPSPHLLQQTMG